MTAPSERPFSTPTTATAAPTAPPLPLVRHHREGGDEPTIGSLCSGYGGLEMGLQLALGGGRIAWHVENDAAPSLILAHHHPDVPNYGDLKNLDLDQMERVTWMTAGYPCQPFSGAGKRLGAADERHLWPFVASAIGVLRPRHVLLENVANHLRLGFISVLADLAALGYDARWGVVRAAEVGAPHGRARLFVVADAADPGGEALGFGAGLRESVTAGLRRGRPDDGGAQSAAANADREGREGSEPSCGPREERRASADDWRRHTAGPSGGTGVNWGAYGPAIARWERVTGRAAPRPTQRGRAGERLSPRFVEWLMGLPDGYVTAVPGLTRPAQLKALGNGVVPQQGVLAVRLLTATSSCGVAA